MLEEINFDYKVRSSALSYAKSLASRLRVWGGTEPNFQTYECPIEELLHKPYVLEEFKPDLIKECLNRLTPENSIIMIVSQSHKEKYEPDEFETEFYYGTQYIKAKLSEDSLKKMREA